MKLLFLLLKFAKLGKVLTTGGTMLISVFAYALIYGWRYAVGFVALLFVHEMGHFVAARQRGLDVGAPTFIPFVGAWIQLKEIPHDVETEAYVGIAGPFIGTLGALACYFFARSYDSNLLLALAYAGFFLNLFNLIPLSPFDGGRITAIISPRVWLLGVPILIAVLAASQVMKALKFDATALENAAYYQASNQMRFTYACYYLLLLGFLSVMTYDVHEMLGGIHNNSLGS